LVAAGEIIADCIDLFKILSCVYYPFIPTASEKVAKIVEFNILDGFKDAFIGVKAGAEIKSIGILFQKLEETQVDELRNKFSGKK